jgi:5,10-methenyltetrahydrofolate synthetase
MAEESNDSYASPLCFMHELDPATGTPGFDAAEWRDVARWRKAERERLIAARLTVSADARAAMTVQIAAGIDALIGDPKDQIISLYWPFRGEPDLRSWIVSITDRGATAALPVVIEKGRPLEFRAYRPGDRLEKGVWNIPVPTEGKPITPDIVLAPVVGFDPQGYRLGYGGGFFDRTLAALPAKPLVIGLGYSQQAIATIYPQPHDIVMDRIVTEVVGS